MKLKFLTKLLVSVLMVFCAFTFIACSDDDDDSPSIDSAIVGTWIDEEGSELTLKSNGTWEMEYEGESYGNGTFSASGGTVKVTFPGEGTQTGTYKVVGDTLTITYKDGDETYVSTYTRKK